MKIAFFCDVPPCSLVCLLCHVVCYIYIYIYISVTPGSFISTNASEESIASIFRIEVYVEHERTAIDIKNGQQGSGIRVYPLQGCNLMGTCLPSGHAVA
jgi:hypothetical protein